MNAGSSSGEGSAASFVDGPMRKEGSTAFVFPLGDKSTWARLAIGTPSSSTTFEVQYFRSGFTDVNTMSTLPAPVLNNVSLGEYWNLTRNTGSGTATVDLYWENADAHDITDCSDLKLGRWSGGAWENAYNTGASGTCTGSGSGSISSGAAVTSFTGPLTFGSLVSGTTNPLPIELVSFEAIKNESNVELFWSTATETNNDFFTIEKSKDAINFESVMTVTGSGNTSTTKNYSAIDNLPYEGLSYYRLKQTDFDGMFSYSEIRPIQFDKETGIVIFPNPSDGSTFNFRMKGKKGQRVNILLYNTTGRLLYFKSIVQKDGSMTETINLNNRLSPGIYPIIGRGNNIFFQRRLIIK